MKKKTKKPSVRKLKKDAWTIFSRYIRLRESDENGELRCVTCGHQAFWKEMHAGHFIGGRMNSILFDERNVHPQCVACNMFKEGNKVEYFRYMQEEYNDEVIDELRFLSKQSKKFTIDDLEGMVKRYKGWVKDIKWLREKDGLPID